MQTLATDPQIFKIILKAPKTTLLR